VHKRAALQSELKLLEAQGVRSSSMKNVAMRILSGWFGLNLASIAILGPLLFIANEMQEMESAKQYHGQVSIRGAVGGCVLMFGVSALSGIAAYRLLRRAGQGRNRYRLATVRKRVLKSKDFGRPDSM